MQLITEGEGAVLNKHTLLNTGANSQIKSANCFLRIPSS